MKLAYIYTKSHANNNFNGGASILCTQVCIVAPTISTTLGYVVLNIVVEISFSLSICFRPISKLKLSSLAKILKAPAVSRSIFQYKRVSVTEKVTNIDDNTFIFYEYLFVGLILFS